MKRFALLAIAASVALAGAPARGDDFRATAPPPLVAPHRPPPAAIREGRLSNGVRILVVERHEGLPIVSLRVVSDLGALEAEPGVAYLAAESALWGESDLARSFQEISALRGVEADWDGVHVDVSCLTPALDRAIELAWDAATGASFHATRVQGARIRGLHKREEGRWSAMRALHEALYPSGDSMHDGLWGTRAQAEAVKPEQLESYFARAFASDHVTLVVVGDTTLEAVTESAARWLGGARTSNAPTPSPLAPSAPNRSLEVIDHPGSTQSSIAIGAIGAPRVSADFAALKVLAAALGRRLDRNLRQRFGYTYGFDVRASGARSRGQILIEGKVETWHTGQALRELQGMIDQLRSTPLDDTELAVAKTLRRSLDPRDRETSAAAAGALVSLVEDHLPIDTWPHELAAIDAVTKDDVLRVARTYLDPAHMPIVIVGDAKAIVPSLPPDLAPATPATPPPLTR